MKSLRRIIFGNRCRDCVRYESANPDLVDRESCRELFNHKPGRAACFYFIAIDDMKTAALDAGGE